MRSIEDQSDKAYALKLENGRYFYRFGRGRAVLTAWSLAGARLFQMNGFDLEEVTAALVARGKVFSAVLIVEMGAIDG